MPRISIIWEDPEEIVEVLEKVTEDFKNSTKPFFGKCDGDVWKDGEIIANYAYDGDFKIW